MELLLRPEYPRPQFVRDTWLNLNGVWDFAFDDNDEGLRAGWQDTGLFDRQINVPFPFQSRLSGIDEHGFHDVIWYRRTFRVPDDFAGKRGLLHFGAVDYSCHVWLNGELLGVHRGGFVPFTFDITARVNGGDNTLVLRVVDTQDTAQPRGKQAWTLKPARIWYNRTSGIWQTVWLEAVPGTYIADAVLTPDFDSSILRVSVDICGDDLGRSVQVSVVDGGFEVAHATIEPGRRDAVLAISHAVPWSPEAPHLYDVRLSLVGAAGQVLDEVRSYFGMRKVSIANGKVLLNNQPYYLKLALDQGFFPDGQFTPPADAALKADVEWAKRLGFNGVRKHQKVEDPRWHYWCDRLGLLVWGEMGNAYDWTREGEEQFTEEWEQVVRRDRNHPCIIVWIPFNESWGIRQVTTDWRQQDYTRRVVGLTRRLDPSRLVVDNDGWEHTDASDLCTIHDYVPTSEGVIGNFHAFLAGKSAVTSTRSQRRVFVEGYRYRGEPILYTEYGGIGLMLPWMTPWENIWGYADMETTVEGFLKRYKDVTSALLNDPNICGFCYTQLTDVEQEINGLLTYDRQPKVDPALIAAINNGQA